MPRSGPSAVGDSTGLTIVHSQTLVSVPASSDSPVLQSSTLFSSSSLSTPTSSSSTAVPTPDRLLRSPQATDPITSSTNRVDSSFYSSSATSTASATDTFFTVQQEPDASHSVALGGSSPATYGNAPPDAPPATMPSRSKIPSRAHPPGPPGSSSSTPPSQSESTPPAPPSLPTPAAGDAGSVWVPSYTKHYDNGKGASTLDHAPEPMSISAPTSTPASTSNSGATIHIDSKYHFHHFSKWSKRPQQIVSTIPDTRTTHSGVVFQTTLTLESIGPGSLIPVPTNSSNVSPNNSSNSNSLLPLILGLLLGILGIVALGAALFRCRGRIRSKYMPTALSYDSESSQERKYNMNMMTEATPRVKTVTRITPYRPSSTYTREHVATRISHAGESFQSSDGPLSDPFADSSTILSSRTSMPPSSIHSVDSVSTNLEFARSVNTDTQEGGDFSRLTEESTSSVELHFAPPLVLGRGSLTRTPCVSPTWHYDSQSPRSSSAGEEFRNEEGRDETSRVSPPASSWPFLLGTESARLRLHALLKEAGRV